MNSSEGWENIRVEDLGDIVAGGTPDRTNPSYWGGSIPWVTPTEITGLKGKYIRETAEHITKAGLAGSGAQLLPIGTVVVTTRATLGETAITSVPLATNQGFKNVVPNKETDSLFAFYLLKNLRPEMLRLSSGTTFLEISKSDFARINTRRPKIDEQRRIAAVLGTMDETIAKTEAVIAKLHQVRDGLLHDLLTRGLNENGQIRDPIAHPEQFKDSVIGRIPKHWDVQLLKEIVQPNRRITYGIVQPGEFDPNGVLLIRGQDYIDGWAPTEAFFKVRRPLHTLYQRSLTTHGDLLMCIVGATTGSVAQVPDWIEEANITQTTARIACDPKRVNGRFCFHMLKSGSGQAQVRRYLKGSAQPGLNLGDVELFLIPMPINIGEQDSIATILDNYDSAIESTQIELEKLHRLKPGVMCDLLSGRVRVPEGII